MIEKYLKISDFIKFILDTKDVLMASQMKGKKTDSEVSKVIIDYLNEFLTAVQVVIDFDLTAKVLLDYELAGYFLNELFDQTD